MNGLDLFSGIGGLSLALAPWVRTVAYCENDPHARAVLLDRQRDGRLHAAPIWDDVQTFTGAMLPPIDIVFGGFPCQDISAAGRGRGLGGERSGLYWQVHRLIREIRPNLVFLENVPAIRTRGLREVVGSLADIGYDCRWTSLSAASVGAPHLRKRWFLLAADTKCLGVRDELWGSFRAHGTSPSQSLDDGAKEYLADAERKRLQGSEHTFSGEGKERVRRRPSNAGLALAHADRARQPQLPEGGHVPKLRTLDGRETLADSPRERWRERDSLGRWRAQRADEKGERRHRLADSRRWWAVEPDVGRVVNGLPYRVDRIKRLGNAVVPAQAREAFLRLFGEGL